MHFTVYQETEIVSPIHGWIINHTKRKEEIIEARQSIVHWLNKNKSLTNMIIINNDKISTSLDISCYGVNY